MSNPVSSKTYKASLRHMDNKLMYSYNTKTFQKHLWCFGLLNFTVRVLSVYMLTSHLSNSTVKCTFILVNFSLWETPAGPGHEWLH